VESYLFRETGAWQRFIANAEMLPVDSSSVFVRPYGVTVSAFTVVRQPDTAGDSAVTAGITGRVQRIPLMRDDQTRSPFSGILRTFEANRQGLIRAYPDVFRVSG
jgi:hypothetical protein